MAIISTGIAKPPIRDASAVARATLLPIAEAQVADFANSLRVSIDRELRS
jgi:hypothetical protein